jgi:hypothetical protein
MTSHQISRLAPIPSKDALFGDVKQKLTELDNTRNSLQKRNLAMREKSELALQVCSFNLLFLTGTAK